MERLLQEFVERRVMPQYQEIVFRFCAQMKDQAPDAVLRMRGGTEKYYPVPVYRTAKDIVAISPTKTGVTFSFTNGAAFSDPYGLLRGHGKRSRTVVVKRIEDYPVDEMASYMRQAAAMGDL